MATNSNSRIKNLKDYLSFLLPTFITLLVFAAWLIEFNSFAQNILDKYSKISNQIEKSKALIETNKIELNNTIDSLEFLVAQKCEASKIKDCKALKLIQENRKKANAALNLSLNNLTEQ